MRFELKLIFFSLAILQFHYADARNRGKHKGKSRKGRRGGVDEYYDSYSDEINNGRLGYSRWFCGYNKPKNAFGLGDSKYVLSNDEDYQTAEYEYTDIPSRDIYTQIIFQLIKSYLGDQIKNLIYVNEPDDYYVSTDYDSTTSMNLPGGVNWRRWFLGQNSNFGFGMGSSNYNYRVKRPPSTQYDYYYTGVNDYPEYVSSPRKTNYRQWFLGQNSKSGFQKGFGLGSTNYNYMNRVPSIQYDDYYTDYDLKPTQTLWRRWFLGKNSKKGIQNGFGMGSTNFNYPIRRPPRNQNGDYLIDGGDYTENNEEVTDISAPDYGNYPEPTNPPAPDYGNYPEPTNPPAPDYGNYPEPTNPPAPDYGNYPEPTNPPVPDYGNNPEPTNPPAPDYGNYPEPTNPPAPDYGNYPEPTNPPVPDYGNYPEPTNPPAPDYGNNFEVTDTPFPDYVDVGDISTPDYANYPEVTELPLPDYSNYPEPIEQPVPEYYEYSYENPSYNANPLITYWRRWFLGRILKKGYRRGFGIGSTNYNYPIRRPQSQNVDYYYTNYPESVDPAGTDYENSYYYSTYDDISARPQTSWRRWFLGQNSNNQGYGWGSTNYIYPISRPNTGSDYGNEYDPMNDANSWGRWFLGRNNNHGFGWGATNYVYKRRIPNVVEDYAYEYTEDGSTQNSFVRPRKFQYGRWFLGLFNDKVGSFNRGFGLGFTTYTYQIVETSETIEYVEYSYTDYDTVAPSKSFDLGTFFLGKLSTNLQSITSGLRKFRNRRKHKSNGRRDSVDLSRWFSGDMNYGLGSSNYQLSELQNNNYHGKRHHGKGKRRGSNGRCAKCSLQDNLVVKMKSPCTSFWKYLYK